MTTDKHFDKLNTTHRLTQMKKLPEGWEWKKLGEVAVIKPPKREAKAKLAGNENVSFLPMEDLGVLSKNINLSKIRKLSEVEGSYTYFAENDVLLAKITPCFENGKLGIAKKLINGIGFGSSEYIVFRPSTFLFNEYLFYFLSQESFRREGIISMTGAVGHKRVAKGFIESFPIPLPPLPEQKRIVAILDEAFAAVDRAKANAEKNLANAKELFESYLNGVFAKPGEDWEEKRLGEVAEKIITGPFGSMLHKSDYIENGIPVVNPQNIVDNKIIPLQKTMINKETFKRLEKYALQLNDIVIARRGEMGRCAVVKEENIGWLCGTGSFVIRVNNKISDSVFLNIFLGSPITIKRLEKLSIGATMSNLNQTILSDLILLLPPLETQRFIVRQLDTLRTETQKLEEIYQKNINALDELKKSILKKAFEGEL